MDFLNNTNVRHAIALVVGAVLALARAADGHDLAAEVSAAVLLGGPYHA